MNYTDEEQIALEYVFTNEEGEEIEKVLIISSKDLARGFWLMNHTNQP